MLYFLKRSATFRRMYRTTLYRITLGSCFIFTAVAPIFSQTNIIQAVPVLPAGPPPAAPTASVVALAPAVAAAAALVWDADAKEYTAKPGDLNAPFIFNFTNTSSTLVVISNAVTSCGCTVASLPVQPWPIPPGSNGQINVSMNLAGKQGRVTKQVTINSSEGSKALTVNVNMPTTAPVSAENMRGDRNLNMALAKADRQAVFKGDCRSCHVDKGVGKMGAELFAADCGICHDSPHRAAMVPDLRAPKAPRDQDYWMSWITYGRPGSMMPAFGEKDGGPLTKQQVDSLVVYLFQNFPQGIVTPAPAAPPANVPLPTLLPIPGPKTGASQ